MFESILIKGHSDNNEQFDPGLLAEAMLFYSRVKLVCYPFTLPILFQKFPPLMLLRALEQGILEIYYVHEQTLIATYDAGTNREMHQFFRANKQNSIYPDFVENLFYEAAGKSFLAKLASKKFARLLKVISYEGFNEQVIIDDVLDSKYMVNTVCKVLEDLIPSYRPPKDLVFFGEKKDDKLVIETNLDFVSLNKMYGDSATYVQTQISNAFFLTHIQGAHLDIYFAAKLTSEISTNRIHSTILSSRFQNIINAQNNSGTKINMFSEYVFYNGSAISEAINTGRCNWVEYLKLLEKGKKFKKWIDNQPIEANLLKEYMREAFANTWLDRFPIKEMRWLLFNGGAFAADKFCPGSGLGLSLFDSYVVDRISKGWKPHHFIENKFKPKILRTI